jgi:hypothetical protein
MMLACGCLEHAAPQFHASQPALRHELAASKDHTGGGSHNSNGAGEVKNQSAVLSLFGLISGVEEEQGATISVEHSLQKSASVFASPVS